MVNISDYKYNVDLHVHTRRYSPCAELLDPALIINRIQNCELHGVVITEHDVQWSKKEIREINGGLEGIKIYRGVEVSSADGHFVVIGLDKLDGLGPGISVAGLIQHARKRGAALILVHHHMINHATSLPLDVLSMPDGVNAIEVASTITFGTKQREAECIAKRKGWNHVAGSDAHCIDSVGQTYTAFLELPPDEKALARAICTGAGIPIRAKDSGKS